MYVDKELLLSDPQTITSTAVSEHTIDLGVARDVAKGKPLFVVVVVTTSFADAAETLTIQVITSANADLSSGVVQIQTDAYIPSALAAGREPIVIPLASIAADARYLGLNYLASATFTAGAVKAFVTFDYQSNW